MENYKPEDNNFKCWKYLQSEINNFFIKNSLFFWKGEGTGWYFKKTRTSKITLFANTFTWLILASLNGCKVQGGGGISGGGISTCEALHVKV